MSSQNSNNIVGTAQILAANASGFNIDGNSALFNLLNFLRGLFNNPAFYGVFTMLHSYFLTVNYFFNVKEKYDRYIKANRNRTQKKILYIFEFINATIASLASAFDLLTILTSLTLVLTNISATVANLGAGLFMLGTIITSIIAIRRAINKTDPEYLIQDRLIKCANITKKIERLKTLNKYSPEEIAKQISDLKHTHERLKMQALILYKRYHENLKNADDIKSKLSNLGLSDDKINSAATENEKRLAEHLIKKHVYNRKEQAFYLTLNIVSFVAAAIVFASIFFPPLFIPGFALGIVAATIRGTAFIGSLIYNKLVYSSHRGSAKDQIYTEYTPKTSHITAAQVSKKAKLLSENGSINDLSESKLTEIEKKKIKYHLLYEKFITNNDFHFSKEEAEIWEKVRDHLSNQKNENDFYKKLAEVPKYYRKLLLNTVMEEKIDQKLQEENFGLENKGLVTEKDNQLATERNARSHFSFFHAYGDKQKVNEAQSSAKPAFHGFGDADDNTSTPSLTA